jgi:predicted secreted protein
MLKRIIPCIVCLLLVSVLFVACKAAGPTAQSVNLALNDFTAQNNIDRSIELQNSGSLTVTLGSNGSTGYQWGDAVISDAAVIVQGSHNTIAPTTSLAGAPGKEVWTFGAKAVGTVAIKFSYSRSWETGVPAIYTFTLNVTVK